ncbi:fibronectin/fibrinogen-binding protein [Erysipelothrix sp. HDW6C]|uniref:Rqc2 family fibronectin-binding protein n=1 Tax=Erysipelothrix sp. HDW6C TaxID=2714930 RepID=UPI00140AEE68|nr:NFACT RNA binding domain-containing protein [Erysipelothrix sp. HDW6C]QIK70233.1 fibronectin/fibrinogen-binding protein [Erysipelothrix sp. HDW6C]
MAIDGVLLNRIITKMNAAVPVKINRITQPSNHEFILHCFAGKKMNLFISTHPVFSRVQWTQEKPTANMEQTHLQTLMRKHLDGGIITKIEQYGFDRVIEFHVEHRDDMGVIRPYRLIVELLGKYANVIIVNDENLIIDAQKRISPFENSQRAIVSGGEYDYPPQFDKKSFLQLASYNPDEALRNQFNGISPLLEKEITHRLQTESPEHIVEALQTSDDLFIYDNEFHIIELTHLNKTAVVKPIMEGLDAFYHDIQERDRVKSHTGDLLKLIRRELKRSRQKLPKLYDDLEKAQDSDHLREYGDLLYAFASHTGNGQSSITLKDFSGNDVTIELDPRYGGKDNARMYFKRYQKAKTSLKYLEEQIDRTEERIRYFDALQTQAEQASVEDAQEINDELLDQGIVHQRKLKRKSNQKKKKKPSYITIQYDDETTIYIGKNNIQNDYISFKLARKEDTWFHAAYDFGAHVLIKTPELDEAKIRLCAHFAAYYSKSRLGSSIEVHYTQARNIKKIPGGNLGLVSVATHKSIFIDPDEDLVLSYVNK